MSKQKPVWRVNIGDDPFDHLEFALLCNGVITNQPQSKYVGCLDFRIEGFNDDIAAYETTRTREAKCERVECRYCLGSGVFKTPHIGSSNLCGGCNGKGYRLEAINHAS